MKNNRQPPIPRGLKIALLEAIRVGYFTEATSEMLRRHLSIEVVNPFEGMTFEQLVKEIQGVQND